MELTRKDHLFISEYPEHKGEYLRLRGKGESENWAGIIASRTTPGMNCQDERMRADKHHHGGLSLDGVNFKPESRGDIERRVKELRDQGHNVEKVDTDGMRQAKANSIERKRKAMETPISEIAEQLHKDGAL